MQFILRNSAIINDKTMFARLGKCKSAKNFLLQSCRKFHHKGQGPIAVRKQGFMTVNKYGGGDQRNYALLWKPFGFTVLLNLLWNHIPPVTKTVAAIVSLNIAVFSLWRVKALVPFMTKWFSATPFSGNGCSPMLLSAFSHYSVFHLGINMYVLWSFARPLNAIIDRQQFVGFYLSAAVVSCLCSYAVKIARCSSYPSLGASGALMALIALVCTCRPNSRISVALVDQVVPHSFSAGNAIKGIMLFDLVCLLCGFKRLDHAAHLGGALFGLWYAKYGNRYIWRKRFPVIKLWRRLRSDP